MRSAIIMGAIVPFQTLFTKSVGWGRGVSRGHTGAARAEGSSGYLLLCGHCVSCVPGGTKDRRFPWKHVRVRLRCIETKGSTMVVSTVVSGSSFCVAGRKFSVLLLFQECYINMFVCMFSVIIATLYFNIWFGKNRCRTRAIRNKIFTSRYFWVLHRRSSKRLSEKSSGAAVVYAIMYVPCIPQSLYSVF